jgi:hypothetical protein
MSESDTMHVVPVPGRTVRDPTTMQILPEEGWTVSRFDTFWHRRIADGDVTIEDDPAEPDAAAAEGDPANG